MQPGWKPCQRPALPCTALPCPAAHLLQGCRDDAMPIDGHAHRPVALGHCDALHCHWVAVLLQQEAVTPAGK